MTRTSQFANMASSSYFCEVILFPLSSLVTSPSFMSMSSLVLQLWQLTFMRDWPEIRKSEIPPSEFCPISGDWGELGIPNFPWISLMKYYWILQNTKVTDFFWVIQGKPTGMGGEDYLPLTLGLRKIMNKRDCWSFYRFSCLYSIQSLHPRHRMWAESDN